MAGQFYGGGSKNLQSVEAFRSHGRDVRGKRLKAICLYSANYSYSPRDCFSDLYTFSAFK